MNTSENNYTFRPIGRIRSGFREKFGIPRQSGLADTAAEIIFEPEFSDPEAFRGLEGFSHIWLLWLFSEHIGEPWHNTARPPRLGGNKRVGVFACRTPFRPNPVGISAVRLEKIEFKNGRAVLHVRGADILDNTPILDIKPYIPGADSIPEASGGFADSYGRPLLDVTIPGELQKKLTGTQKEELMQILAQDPRPSYQNDPDRVYGLSYGGLEVKFRIRDDTAEVIGIIPASGI